MDWSFLGHKSDDKIINGSRAMSYLISCIFMKGATQLGPCAMERENKKRSAPSPGMKNAIVETRRGSLIGKVEAIGSFILKRRMEFGTTITTVQQAVPTLAKLNHWVLRRASGL